MNNRTDRNSKELIRKYIENRCTPEELADFLALLNAKSVTLAEFDEAASREWELAGAALSPGEEALLQRQARDLLRHINHVKTNRLRRRRFFRIAAGVAASAAVVVLGVFLHAGLRGRFADPVYTEYATGVGEVRTILLPDGSEVTLNAVSSLRYDQEFGRKERKVTFSGQAFFDVKPDKDRPFLIGSGKLDVTVLGTSFDVKNYVEDEQTTVTVRNGCVAVSYDDSHLRIDLERNEQMQLDKRSLELRKERLSGIAEPLSWMSGNLCFRQTPIAEVVKMLRRHYDAEITLQNVPSGALITGMHDNRSLESVLRSICFSSGLDYEKQGEGYVIHSR